MAAWPCREDDRAGERRRADADGSHPEGVGGETVEGADVRLRISFWKRRLIRCDSGDGGGKPAGDALMRDCTGFGNTCIIAAEST